MFLDSTNLAVGPTSRIVLDRFVYEGDPNAEKVAVGLAKGLFRFTTGNLDKKAYTITTPTAAIGVRGTVLDISVRSADTRVTLVEGLALVCPAQGDGLRPAGAQLRRGVRRERERTLRLRRARSSRTDGNREKGRRDDQASLTVDTGQFRLAVQRRVVALFGRQLRLFRGSVGRRFVRTIVEWVSGRVGEWSMRRSVPLIACIMAGAVLLLGTSAKADVTLLQFINPSGGDPTHYEFDLIANAATTTISFQGYQTNDFETVSGISVTHDGGPNLLGAWTFTPAAQGTDAEQLDDGTTVSALSFAAFKGEYDTFSQTFATNPLALDITTCWISSSPIMCLAKISVRFAQ